MTDPARLAAGRELLAQVQANAARLRDCPSIQAAGDSSLTLQLIPFGTVRVLCDIKGRHPRPVSPLTSAQRTGGSDVAAANPLTG